MARWTNMVKYKKHPLKISIYQGDSLLCCCSVILNNNGYGHKRFKDNWKPNTPYFNWCCEEGKKIKAIDDIKIICPKATFIRGILTKIDNTKTGESTTYRKREQEPAHMYLGAGESEGVQPGNIKKSRTVITWIKTDTTQLI